MILRTKIICNLTDYSKVCQFRSALIQRKRGIPNDSRFKSSAEYSRSNLKRSTAFVTYNSTVNPGTAEILFSKVQNYFLVPGAHSDGTGMNTGAILPQVERMRMEVQPCQGGIIHAASNNEVLVAYVQRHYVEWDRRLLPNNPQGFRSKHMIYITQIREIVGRVECGNRKYLLHRSLEKLTMHVPPAGIPSKNPYN